MADNVPINAGSGTNIAADDIGGVYYQRVKVSVGADGSAGDATPALPLPVAAALESARVFVNGVAVTPKFAKIDAASSGQNTIVAAVTSKVIRVLAYLLMSEGTVAAKWRTGASTDLSGALPLVANVGAVANFSPIGHLETASGEALTMNLNGAVGVRGHLAYIEV